MALVAIAIVALYSALIKGKAIFDCFLLLHVMIVDPKLKQYLKVDLELSTHLTQ